MPALGENPAKGTTYLIGRLGGVRITILPNRDREGDGDASHVLLMSQADVSPRRPDAQREEPHSPAPQSRQQPDTAGQHAAERSRSSQDGLPLAKPQRARPHLVNDLPRDDTPF